MHAATATATMADTSGDRRRDNGETYLHNDDLAHLRRRESEGPKSIARTRFRSGTGVLTARSLGFSRSTPEAFRMKGSPSASRSARQRELTTPRSGHCGVGAGGLEPPTPCL